MAVRAKLRVNSINEERWGSGEGNVNRFVIFGGVYDTSIPEDQRFQQATPYAEAKFKIDNPAAIEQFKPGESYYVDFTPVPKPES